MVNPGGEPPLSDDDARWLERLRSAENRPPDGPAEREADRLRHAVQAKASRDDADLAARYDDARMARGADRLQAALRAELAAPAAAVSDAAGLGAQRRDAVDAAPAQGLKHWLARFDRWLMPAAMTATAVVAAVLFLPMMEQGSHYPEPPVVRSDGPPMPSITDRQPRDRAEALAREAREQGLMATLYQKGAHFILDLGVPHGREQAAAGILASFGLPAAAGDYRLEIRPAP